MKSSSVTFRVPATTSNMGPGFDTFGCAFALYNRFTLSPAEENRIVGSDPAFAGEENPFLTGFREACQKAGVKAPAIQVVMETDIPSTGGLGSSASLLVGGIGGANRLLGLGMTKSEIAELASRLEGHPDNAVPAVFGGLRAALLDENTLWQVAYPLSTRWRFCALIADFTVSTRRFRAMLPEHISRSDALFNSSRAALLPAALAGEDPSLLTAVLHDRLHEPYRLPAIPDAAFLRDLITELGACGFFLSGSGSTCMAIYTEEDFPTRLTRALASPVISGKLTNRWRPLPLVVDWEGLSFP